MEPHTRPTIESTTDSILIVLDHEDPEATMRTALPYAADIADDVHLLMVYPNAKVDAREQAYTEARTSAPRSVTQLEEAAEQVATRVGRAYLGENADFEAMGAVGKPGPMVAAAAEWSGCSRVYVANDERRAVDRLRQFLDLPNGIAKALPGGIDLLTYEDLVGDRPVIDAGIEESHAIENR